MHPSTCPYIYSISFQITHRSLSLADEYAIFEKNSNHVLSSLSDIGQLMFNFKDRPPVFHENSYFDFRLSNKWESSDKITLEKGIIDFLGILEGYDNILQKIVQTGGNLCLVIYYGFDENSGFVFSPDISKKLADRNIDVFLGVSPFNNPRYY